MKKEREPAAKRLARYRRKDSLLDALIAGDVTTGDGAHNDRYMMTLLMHRCFSLAEIKAIMGPLTNGDNEKRAAMGDRYWLLVRREILGHLTPEGAQNLHPQKSADRPHVPIAKRIADLKSDT